MLPALALPHCFVWCLGMCLSAFCTLHTFAAGYCNTLSWPTFEVIGCTVLLFPHTTMAL